MDNRRWKLGVLGAVYLMLAAPAHAYLDGATGSMLIQALIGGVATWAMYSRMFAARLRSFFVRAPVQGESADEAK
jgi:hypothetical protein